jgi:hypothetical protein
MTALALLLSAATLAAEDAYTWNQTDTSLVLVRGDDVVWKFTFEKEGKPYFHPLTVAGGPSLTDFRPADHPWHRARWFSWKSINGLLYWDEDPKTAKSPGVTEVVSVMAEPRFHQAHVELGLSYHPPASRPC